MKALEVLFWISLFIVFYTYIGYGILLYILVKIKECFRKPAPRPMPADDALPPLTLFIAAYNEEDVVDEKMHNCLELDYPADKLRILWVTDGSNDHTNERLSHWPQAIVLHQPQRQGKTAALNRGIHFVETPLVVFTDANTHLNREALREIVHAFTDPKVGCVAGEKRIAVQSKDNAASGGEGLYWKYESTLKALDARLYSAVGAAGELFAVRRELFEESGALDYDIAPLCDYQFPHGAAMVFTANIRRLGQLPESEIAQTRLFDAMPAELTYPYESAELLEYAARTNAFAK